MCRISVNGENEDVRLLGNQPRLLTLEVEAKVFDLAERDAFFLS